MESELPPIEFNQQPARVLACAGLLAVLVFLLIPLTQHTVYPQTPKIESREIYSTEPPPPIPPLPETEPIPETTTTAKPTYERQSRQLVLNPLERSLDPGIDEALAIRLSTADMGLEIDAIGDIQEIFTFADLSQAPRVLNRPRVYYPNELSRQGIRQGHVVALIEIDEKGDATIIRILSATHQALIRPAKETIRQAQFTPPIIDGVPQKVRGEWPIELRAP